MGFGFVEYKERADAIRALRELQGATLDGHQLALKLSNQNSVRQGTVQGVLNEPFTPIISIFY